MTGPRPPRAEARGRTSRRQFAPRPTPPPGRRAMTLTAITIGVLLLGVQLWLLTVAVDLYLGGEGHEAWTLALVSGLVFAGGVFAYWLLRDPHPSIPRPSSREPQSREPQPRERRSR